MPNQLCRRLLLAFSVACFSGLFSPELCGQQPDSIQVVVTPPTQKFKVEVTVPAPPADALVFWACFPRSNIETVSRTSTKWVMLAPVGNYEVQHSAISKTGQVDSFKAFKVGDGPAPDPDPKPPVPPTPDVKPPIPADGLRVLIVYEDDKQKSYPSSQQAIMYSQPIRDFLNKQCVIGPDGKTREWRMYDKDILMDGESKLWIDAMLRKRTTYPWLIISNGKTGYEGPLPLGTKDFTDLVGKYTEAK